MISRLTLGMVLMILDVVQVGLMRELALVPS